MMIIGIVIRYKGKKVKVVERDRCWPDKYWVEALEPVDGFEPREQLIMSKKLVEEKCK